MHIGTMYRNEFIRHLDWVDAIWDETVRTDDEPFARSDDFLTKMVDKASVLTAVGGDVFVYVMPWVYRVVPQGESMTLPARALFGILAEKGSSYEIGPIS